MHFMLEEIRMSGDSGCSNHMTGDKSKCIMLEKYDGGSIRFGDDQKT